MSRQLANPIVPIVFLNLTIQNATDFTPSTKDCFAILTLGNQYQIFKEHGNLVFVSISLYYTVSLFLVNRLGVHSSHRLKTGGFSGRNRIKNVVITVLKRENA